MKISHLENGLLMNSIMELNDELRKNNVHPITLNVIGGFALMAHGVRKNKDAVTDVDYIGADLPKYVQEIAAKIGVKNGLGAHWVNNDVLLSGSSLEEMEYSTDELNFSESIELSHINMRILDKPDLLKMKVIAIDTSLSGVELGGEFTRLKDFEDVTKLMEELHLSISDVKKMTTEYVLLDDTYPLIEEYMLGGVDSVNEYIENMQELSLEDDDFLNSLDAYLDMT